MYLAAWPLVALPLLWTRKAWCYKASGPSVFSFPTLLLVPILVSVPGAAPAWADDKQARAVDGPAAGGTGLFQV